MEDCLFCKIINKEIQANILYEDESALAFLDVHPRSPGHTLVIPKTHSPNLLEMEDENIPSLLLAVKKVEKAIKNRLNPDGFTVGINQGKAGGQEVDHLHIHVMPRWANDKGSSVQSVVHNTSDNDETLKRLGF